MSESTNPSGTPRSPRAYEPPELTVLGNVQELTQGVGTRGRDQSGTKSTRH